MRVEIPNDSFGSEGRSMENKALFSDLRELVLKKQENLKRINNLRRDMKLYSSDKSMRDSQDEELLRQLSEENDHFVREIYDKCIEYGEDCGRFLSESEIRGLSIEARAPKH